MTEFELKHLLDEIVLKLTDISKRLKTLERHIDPAARMESFAVCTCNADYTGLPHSDSCARRGLK